MLISELSKKTGASPHRIRYYERFELLGSRRDPTNNYRVYDDQAIERIRLIDNLKGLGFSLNQIQGLLKILEIADDESLGRAHDILVHKHGELEEQVRQFQGMLNSVRELMKHCEHRPVGKTLDLDAIMQSLENGRFDC